MTVRRKSSRLRTIAAPLLGAMFLAAALPVRAQETDNVAAGRALAETWCSSCHAINPANDGKPGNMAPSFAAIARMKSMTPMALRVFLQTPHSRMPDLRLSQQEIDHLSSYIFSLGRRDVHQNMQQDRMALRAGTAASAFGSE